LPYLEGREHGQPQGVVFGDVFRRTTGPDGKPALKALCEPLQVVAEGVNGRVEVTTDQWEPYQLVLPPGDYEVWVEQAGRALGPRHAVHVENGSDRPLTLIVEYQGSSTP